MQKAVGGGTTVSVMVSIWPPACLPCLSDPYLTRVAWSQSRRQMGRGNENDAEEKRSAMFEKASWWMTRRNMKERQKGLFKYSKCGLLRPVLPNPARAFVTEQTNYKSQRTRQQSFYGSIAFYFARWTCIPHELWLFTQKVWPKSKASRPERCLRSND